MLSTANQYCQGLSACSVICYSLPTVDISPFFILSKCEGGWGHQEDTSASPTLSEGLHAGSRPSGPWGCCQLPLREQTPWGHTDSLSPCPCGATSAPQGPTGQGWAAPAAHTCRPSGDGCLLPHFTCTLIRARCGAGGAFLGLWWRS